MDQSYLKGNMNIFYLSADPKLCAEFHCDKHVVKMILEYAQLMSTAHRVLDGINNVLPDEKDSLIYKATHANHPSSIWIRESECHYNWVYDLWKHLLQEYSHRYKKEHKTGRLDSALSIPPKNIAVKTWRDPTQAMPDECKLKNTMALEAYRQYYVMKKNHIAKWTNRSIPNWYSSGILDMLVAENQMMGLYD